MNKSANEANPLKFTNFIKIMKLTLFFLFFSILLSQAANTFSQETEFTLHLKSATIKEVCKEMEKSSNYRFIFEGNANRAANKKVDLSANSQNIEEILDELLSGTDLSYRVLDNQVVVYRDREKREVKGVNMFISPQKYTSISIQKYTILI